MKEETKGYIYGVLAAFFWGTHSVIVRYLTASIGGITVAALRLWVAVVAIFIILSIAKSKIDWQIKNKKWFIVVALLGMTANFIVFHLGLEYTTASNAMLLENTAPIFALLFLLIFLKEKIKKLDVLAVITTFIGVIIVVTGSKGLNFFNTTEFTGDMLEIAGGAFWAIFLVGSSKIFAKEKNTVARLSNLLKIFIVTAVVLTPWIFFKPPVLTAHNIKFLILLGVFPTAIAFWLWYEAAARIPTIAAVLLFNLAIIFTFINAKLFLNEKISLQLIIGALIILIGITLTKIRNHKRSPSG